MYQSSINAKLNSIRAGEFLENLVNDREQCLSFKDDTINDLSILDHSKCPSNPSICHGEEQFKRLCKQVTLCTDKTLNGMQDLVEEPNSESKDLKPLMHENIP